VKGSGARHFFTKISCGTISSAIAKKPDSDGRT
jgi:hypothetical protein